MLQVGLARQAQPVYSTPLEIPTSSLASCAWQLSGRSTAGYREEDDPEQPDGYHRKSDDHEAAHCQRYEDRREYLRRHGDYE